MPSLAPIRSMRKAGHACCAWVLSHSSTFLTGRGRHCRANASSGADRRSSCSGFHVLEMMLLAVMSTAS